jgi:crotonobetainyl-CoA:carnitine CoA-transferase CaiB-like acyl-CoA transferase
MPLAGLSALALGQGEAVEFLCRLLSDQGVTVSRVQQGEEGRTLVRSCLAGTGVRDIVIDADDTGLADDEPATAAVGGPKVVCSLSSFPRPYEGDNRPCDWAVAAELGLYRSADANEPFVEPLPLPSAYGAVWAASVILAGLRIHARTGVTQRVAVDLFTSSLILTNHQIQMVEDGDIANGRKTARLPVWEIYRCGDGRFIQCHGGDPKFVALLCDVLGHPEWTHDARDALRDAGGEDGKRIWRERFASAFGQKSALEWEDALAACGAAGTVCRTREEWTELAHARDSEILSAPPPTPSDRIVGTAVRVRISREEPADLRDLHDGPWPAGSVGGRRSPLHGIRVLDFCIVLAGPTCGRVLAHLGADVIKIDSPRRSVSPWGWLDLSRGKRSLFLDLKHPEGQDIAREMVRRADVLVENYREGRMEKLGLGYDEVRRLNPRLIYASLNAFDYGGDWSERPGWEHNAQAVAGMQVDRKPGATPQQLPVPANDYCTGFLLAYGVQAALAGRERTGLGSRVTASLARTATYLQTPFFDERLMSRRAPVEIRRCADGWLAMTATDRLEGLEELDVSASIQILRSRNIRAVKVRAPLEMSNLDWVRDRSFVVSYKHPHYGQVTQASLQAGFDDEAGNVVPAPDPGEDSVAILREFGLDESEIDELLRKSVIGTGRALRGQL